MGNVWKVQKTWKVRNVWKIATAAFIFAAFSSFAGYGGEMSGYQRSATYTSDAWVSNFWNTESDHMEEELAQIAANGFNSIVLVVPWREFQPGMMPASYNTYAFQKLHQVMQAAQRQGLGVMMRVGYTWDYYDTDSSNLRFRELVRDPSVRTAWIAYADHLYQQASGYENFCGGFLTWEDFWNYVEDATCFGTGQYSKNEAKKIGYQDYLKQHYSLQEISRRYGLSEPFSSYEEIYIPQRGIAACELFYEFYNSFLSDLLEDTQKVFPGLSMEVRLDSDPVGDGGENGWYSHRETFECRNASYTALMYSVSMGYGAGTLLTAQQAWNTMGELLGYVRRYNQDKPIYIDQLLYMDETEMFSYNAKLHESQRSLYLTGLPDILRSYTNGYAVWTYRNYGNNPVYNCQFALGKRGWEVENASVEERNGSRQMHLGVGGSISQKIGHRISDRNTKENYVRFTAESSEPVMLTVQMGRTEKQVEVNGRQSFELNMGKISYYDLTFLADGELYLDNIQVYNFVQDGQLYDMDGKELSCLGAMRQLNAQMQ